MAEKYLEHLYFAGTRQPTNIWWVGKNVDNLGQAGTKINPNTYYMVGGTVKTNGVGTRNRVVLLDRNSCQFVMGTYSNPDGTWFIKGIKGYALKQLLFIAFNDTEEFNAEVIDYVSCKEMT